MSIVILLSATGVSEEEEEGLSSKQKLCNNNLMIVIQGGSLSTVTCPLSYPVLENIRKVLGVTYSSPTLPFPQLHNIEWCCLEALYHNTFTSQWRCVLRQRRRGTWTVIYIKYFCYLWEIFLHPTVSVHWSAAEAGRGRTVADLTSDDNLRLRHRANLRHRSGHQAPFKSMGLADDIIKTSQN